MSHSPTSYSFPVIDSIWVRFLWNPSRSSVRCRGFPADDVDGDRGSCGGVTAPAQIEDKRARHSQPNDRNMVGSSADDVS